MCSFYMRLIVSLAVLSCIYQVTTFAAAVQSFDKNRENDLQKYFMEMLSEKLKSAEYNVSRKIDSFVNNGLDRLVGYNEKCKAQAQMQLNHIREDLQTRLLSCSDFSILEDQLNMVKADFDLAIKTIVGNGLSGIVKFGDCIGSDDPFVCLTTVWVPMTGIAVAEDLHASVDTVFEVLKLFFEGTEAVWSCIKGDSMNPAVSTVLSQAHLCHHNRH